MNQRAKNRNRNRNTNRKLLLVGCVMLGVLGLTACGKEDPTIVLSHDSGFYEKEFELTMSVSDEGEHEIYYTVDGTDPTFSDTAVLYTEPVKVRDRKHDSNVVSAVDPNLIAGSFNYPNGNRDGFECQIKAPSNGAVDKGMVIRAAIKKKGGEFCGETGLIYFIGSPAEHIEGLAESCENTGKSLAVMSITVEYDDFFDSKKGIYVKGDVFKEALAEYLEKAKIRDGETARSLDANYKQKGREWEREVSAVLMEVTPDGAQVVINQNCGIRIQGNYSRSDLQKGLRLYARADYSENNFDYAVFGEEYLNDAGEVMDKFKTLVLRAGGNCAFTAKFNDTYWQSLLEETACDMKHSRPCVVYLNGEYWGLYVLEEDYSDDYFEDLHGVDKNTVVLYKGDAEALEIGYKLDEGEIPEGEGEDYYYKDLLEFFDNHNNLESEEDYQEFIKMVDPESVMDYFAVQCWINNKWDWPGKNWSMWKTTKVDEENPYADGRWRFLFYDMEFGGVSGVGDVPVNTIKEDNYKPKGLLDKKTDNPAVLCFAYLMTNDGFKDAFCERLTGLARNEFDKKRAMGRLSEFEAAYGPLYDQFFDRYPGTGTKKDALKGGYASSECIRAFVASRENHIHKQIDFVHQILGE